MIFYVKHFYIFFFAFLFFLLQNHEDEKIFLSIFICNKIPRLFFGIITIEKSFERRKFMYDLWIHKIEKLGHDYAYCTKSPIEPSFNWIPSKSYNDPSFIYKPKDQEDVDRQNKRITLAQYFLTNTKADFFINPTDDVIVDPLRINNFAYILSQNYDTNRDLIMLGNCQITHYKYPYFQGGTGYIMTRKMASQFVNNSRRWMKETRGPDDVSITKFLSYVGLKPSDGAIPYMDGHGLANLINFDITQCPNFYEPICKQGVQRLEDIYIIHPFIKNLTEISIFWNLFQQILNEKNRHYGFYHKIYRTYLCKFN